LGLRPAQLESIHTASCESLERLLLQRIFAFSLILELQLTNIKYTPIIGWARCIVAHPTKILGGPWPTLQRPPCSRCGSRSLRILFWNIELGVGLFKGEGTGAALSAWRDAKIFLVAYFTARVWHRPTVIFIHTKFGQLIDSRSNFSFL